MKRSALPVDRLFDQPAAAGGKDASPFRFTFECPGAMEVEYEWAFPQMLEQRQAVEAEMTGDQVGPAGVQLFRGVAPDGTEPDFPIVLVPGEVATPPLLSRITLSDPAIRPMTSTPRLGRCSCQIVINAVQAAGRFGKPADTDLKGGDAPGRNQGKRRPALRRAGYLFRQGHKEYHPVFKVRFNQAGGEAGGEFIRRLWVISSFLVMPGPSPTSANLVRSPPFFPSYPDLIRVPPFRRLTDDIRTSG